MSHSGTTGPSSQRAAALSDRGELADRLMDRFLLSWLGIWPGRGLLRIAPSARRMLPDPTGTVQPLVGMVTPRGIALSVPPTAFPHVRHAVGTASRGRVADLADLLCVLPAALGHPDRAVHTWEVAWTATAPRRPATARSVTASRVRRLAHTPLGCELVLEELGDVHADTDALAREAGRAVDQGQVALFTYSPDDRSSRVRAAVVGMRTRGWRLLRLAPG